METPQKAEVSLMTEDELMLVPPSWSQAEALFRAPMIGPLVDPLSTAEPHRGRMWVVIRPQNGGSLLLPHVRHAGKIALHVPRSWLSPLPSFLGKATKRAVWRVSPSTEPKRLFFPSALTTNRRTSTHTRLPCRPACRSFLDTPV